MIPIRQTIKREGTGFSRKEWAPMIRRAWLSAGSYWSTVLLPKHFTEKGAREYHYQARDWEYNKKKLRRFGHRLPLVYTGQLRSEVLRIRDVRPGASMVKIVLRGPRYLYPYRKDLNQPNKFLELQAVSDGDAKRLAFVIDRSLTEQAQKAGRTIDITHGHRAA